jgi:hypothetical protein
MHLRAEITGPASLKVFDGVELIAEIRELGLCNVRCRRDGKRLIGDDVPLPLYWQQYADHEDPERNMGSKGRVRVLAETENRLTIECYGENGSQAVESVCTVMFRGIQDSGSCEIDITSSMKVRDGHTWLVTPNPTQGEVEFCTLWPEGIFSPSAGTSIQYDGCYLVRNEGVTRIPHHHAESSDKHNIRLRGGDRMMWLLEDENLCVTILSEEPVSGGICAYMWDAHLAYKICQDGKPHLLPGGTEFGAAFRLSSFDAGTVREYAARAVTAIAPELAEIPLVTDGVQTFADTFGSVQRPAADDWPWETEVVSGNLPETKFLIDRKKGVEHGASLRIDGLSPVHAHWKATTLGPAYRKAAFHDGTRFQLVALVATNMKEGSARIGIRIHRGGAPGLFDPGAYEMYMSTQTLSGVSDFTRVEILTPEVKPAPDRVHLLLELNGSGTVWFTNVHFAVTQ